ncbi:hypothetical protein D3C80_1207030 [compost metagenome]
MDQQQVDVVGAQFGEAFAQAGDQFVGCIVVDPDLGGDEQLAARHAAFGNGLAHVGFVLVDLCGVDGAVAQLQCRADRVDDGLAGKAEGAQAERGNAHGGAPVE